MHYGCLIKLRYPAMVTQDLTKQNLYRFFSASQLVKNSSNSKTSLVLTHTRSPKNFKAAPPQLEQKCP